MLLTVLKQRGQVVSNALPAQFWDGIEQFNRREFYACHDTLEAIWMEAEEPQRTLYQGILQIAVAFYHLSNQNARGAVILLGEGMNRLRPYTAETAQIEVESLLRECLALQQMIHNTPAEELAALWKGLLAGDRALALPTIQRVIPMPDLPSDR